MNEWYIFLIVGLLGAIFSALRQIVAELKLLQKHLGDGSDSSSIKSRLYEISSRQSIIKDDVRKLSSNVDRLTNGQQDFN